MGVLALALASASAFAETGHNDAGSGLDAGDTPSTALALAGYGTYAGNRASSSDADWYSNSNGSTSPVCVKATAWGDAHALVNLTTEGAADAAAATARLTPGGSAEAVIADVGFSRSLLGLTKPSSGGQGGGAYHFTLEKFQVADLGSGDAGTGLDAGATLQSAVDVATGCIKGKLTPNLNLTDPDTLDYYSFQGTAGNRVTYSLARAGEEVVELTLVGPSGAEGYAIRSGEIAKAVLESDGTYYLKALQDSGLQTTYLIGLVDGPDPGDPCRPNCSMVS